MTEFLTISFLAISIFLKFPFRSNAHRRQQNRSNKLKKAKKLVHPINETREVVDFLVLTISAGMTVPNAIYKTSQLCDYELAKQLGHVVRSHNLGASVETELVQISSQDRYWKLVVNQLRQSWERGATILENLSELSEFLVDLEKSATLQKVRSAGVRSVLPLGLCFLPAFILVVVIPLVAGLITN